MLSHLKMRRHLQGSWVGVRRIGARRAGTRSFMRGPEQQDEPRVNMDDNSGHWLFLSVCVYDIPVSDNSFVISLNEVYKYMIVTWQ